MKIFDLHIGASDSVIITGKNCLAKSIVKTKFPNQFDIKRAHIGGLDIFMGAMCCVIEKNNDLVLPKNIKREITKHIKIYTDLEKNKAIQIVHKKDDLLRQNIKTILGLEGIYFLREKNDLSYLEKIIDQGVKVIGPTWNIRSNFMSKTKVNDLGKAFLQICEKRKIIIDLAHSEENYFDIILNNFSGVVFSSHTGYMKIYRHRRNSTKNQLSKIIKRGGIIGLYFIGPFLGGNKIENFYAHLNQILADFGDMNVAIGGDFDGMTYEHVISGLEDVSCYPNLIEYLLKKGIKEKTIERIFYKNAFNFFYNNF